MIIYARNWQQALEILSEAEKWFACKIISKEQFDSIRATYIGKSFSPNIFVRFGLFIFTYVLLSGFIGLVITVTGISSKYAYLFLFFGILFYVLLEILVKVKRLYRAGIDDALLLAAFGLIFFALESFLPNARPEIVSYLIALPLLLWCTIRFADLIMAFGLNVCIFQITILLLKNEFAIQQNMIPFAVMTVSLVIYLVSKTCVRLKATEPWRRCWIFFETSGLATFYLGGNALIAKEIFKLSSLMTLFYLLTAVIPFLYMLLGILRKNAILFRVGLLALAFSIFTFKYYFSVDYTEFLLTGTGIILILLAKLGTHYLKTPKYGFTIENLFKGDFEKAFNLDDMLIGKSLRTTPFPK